MQDFFDSAPVYVVGPVPMKMLTAITLASLLALTADASASTFFSCSFPRTRWTAGTTQDAPFNREPNLFHLYCTSGSGPDTHSYELTLRTHVVGLSIAEEESVALGCIGTADDALAGDYRAVAASAGLYLGFEGAIFTNPANTCLLFGPFIEGAGITLEAWEMHLELRR